MDLTQQILLGVAIPAAVATLLWVAIWRPWARGAGGAPAPRPGGSVAVAGGFLAGYVALIGIPTLAAAGASERIPLLVAACGIFGWFEDGIARAAERGPALRALFCAAIVGFLLWTRISAGAADGLLSARGLAAVGGAAAATALLFFLWALSERGAVRAPAFDGAWIWLATLAAESKVLLGTGNAMMAQFAGAAAASLGPGLVLALWRGAPVMRGGTLAAVVLPAGLFALVGRYFGELTDLPLALLASAPIVGFGVSLASEARGSAPLRWVSLLAPLVPLAIAVWLTGGFALPEG